MTVIDARTPTWVPFCCAEFSATGMGVVVGADAYLEASVEGEYAYAFQVPYTSDCAFLGPMVALALPDDSIDLNTVGETSLEWAANKGAGGVQVLTWPNASTIRSHMRGNNRFTVSITLNGTPGAELWIYLRRDGTDLLAGVPVVIGPSGFGAAAFSAIDLTGTTAQDYQIVGQTLDAASAPVFAVEALSSFIVEHTSPAQVFGYVNVYDAADAFLRQINYNPESGWEGTLHAEGLTSLRSGDRLRFGIYHTADNQQISIGTEVREGGTDYGNANAQMHWVAPFRPIETCLAEEE